MKYRIKRIFRMCYDNSCLSEAALSEPALTEDSLYLLTFTLFTTNILKNL